MPSSIGPLPPSAASSSARTNQAMSSDNAAVSLDRLLAVANVTRLVGDACAGTGQPSSLLWNTVTANGGSATRANGDMILQTNTTANAAVSAQTKVVGRGMGGHTNVISLRGHPGDAGVANNVRRWGAFDANNGIFFQLSGTTLSLVVRASGVDTVIPSAQWPKGFVLDTNPHLWQIEYTTSRARFLIDGVYYGSVMSTGGVPMMATASLPIRLENTNSGGSTSDVTLSMHDMAIDRYGPGSSRPRFIVLGPAGVTVLRDQPGALHGIFVTTQATGAATLNLYDNTTNSGTLIAKVDLNKTIGAFPIEVDVSIGLTSEIIGNGSSAVTVTFD